jgi:hypothetical protein
MLKKVLIDSSAKIPAEYIFAGYSLKFIKRTVVYNQKKWNICPPLT